MNKVVENIPLPGGIEPGAQRGHLQGLNRALSAHLGTVGRRLNESAPKDGSELQQMVSYDAINFPTVTAHVNNANVGYYAIARFTLSGGSFNLTGIANGAGQEGAGGRMLRIINTSASALTLTLKHQSANSDVENRFLLPSGADKAIVQNAAAILWYDPAALRWRVAG